MSQAEIAGGTQTPRNELPSIGYLLRDFTLMSALGHPVQLSAYRGRSSLVLICADERAETVQLLLDLASQYKQIQNEEAEVLVVTGSPAEAAEKQEQFNLPYPILADDNGRIHHELGAADSQGREFAAVYVTDRFGEVFGAYRTRDGQSLPRLADIVNLLEFIGIQCPECEPPEWPV
jgi:peroxiredoxin